ncbi:hypothetical protein CISIN_1g033564mg [Citrus sinensis]|uniref:Pentapeptide repeat-containing protein n=1 Tax=Citrus sinensis TaxID=2711 RepID=A0A067DHM1_CITSI|nr:hypothetical protein CISIN_1g033564mg [Citrus sinensis]
MRVVAYITQLPVAAKWGNISYIHCLLLFPLSGADLSDADLRSADFSLANVTKANLSNANLEGALATGNTSFRGSNITGAGM